MEAFHIMGTGAVSRQPDVLYADLAQEDAAIKDVPSRK